MRVETLSTAEKIPSSPGGFEPRTCWSEVERANRWATGLEIGIHHIHAWSLTSGKNLFSAHIAIDDQADHDEILDAAYNAVGEGAARYVRILHERIDRRRGGGRRRCRSCRGGVDGIFA